MGEQIKEARHSAMEFAEYIIDICTRMENSISDLKLQKVLYYIQLAFISSRKEDAFTDEMEAWPYGPVVRAVYDAYSSYGSTKICLRYEKSDVFDEAEKKIIHFVLLQCLEENVWDLVEMSHVANGPWDKTYQNGKGYKKVISKNLIREYAMA